MSKPKPHLSRRTTPLTPLALPCLLLALTLSSCGSSESLTHIQGSSETITKPMLDHWMRSLVGEDFRQVIGTKGPAGLVSEPANYTECTEAAAKIIPRGYTGRLKLNGAQIFGKCHQLHEAVKAQALAFLLSVQWSTQEAKEQGIQLTDAEVRRQFQNVVLKNTYGSTARERQHLAERHMVHADLLYMLKRNILVKRITPKFEAKVREAGGGERTYVRLALERYHGLIARTSCKPGYVVLGCKEYREPAVAKPSPAVLLEAFVQGAVG
jgi:hypothetical protein